MSIVRTDTVTNILVSATVSRAFKIGVRLKEGFTVREELVGTWGVGGGVQGDRRHAGVSGDRVLVRMLVVRMGERLRLLVRGVIGVERFVACHQRVQHVEHHLRRCRGAATRRLTEIVVTVGADDYGRRLPRRPRRLDAPDARRDVPLAGFLAGAHSWTRTHWRRCTSASVQRCSRSSLIRVQRPRESTGRDHTAEHGDEGLGAATIRIAWRPESR